MVGKAFRLLERMKEKRILVVLDDIWEKLDIEEVGIPLGDEHKGCKLLLTSRELNKMAGNCDERLPIAIATVAGALRNKRLFEWKNALRELESFNYLESEEVKLTFLHCSVIGHNGLVEDLVRYTPGLGLFDGLKTMEEARNKVLTVVANLKASALLLDSYDDERFDIHDVVWDAALAIGLKDYRMIVLRDHVPKEWSDKEKMNRWSVISLRCPRIIANLPKEMEFDDITIRGELKNLEILDLSKSGIKELPMEMAQLTQLRLLDFSWCTKLEIIPPNVLSSLSKLEELYMGGSFGLEGIKNVFVELNNEKDLPHLKRLHVKNGIHVIYWITNLRSLIIKGCGKLEHLLSPSLARSLVQLQCFKIEDCKCLRDIILIEEIEEERKDVICFPRLNSLCIDGLPNLIFFSSGNHNIEFPLLEELWIERCPNFMEFISQSSNESGMHALFSEKVIYFITLRLLYNSVDLSLLFCRALYELTFVAFPRLEKITINKLRNVKMMFHNNFAPGSFQNLREIRVEGCGSLKNLFLVSIAKDLPQLEDLCITNCGVEEIVSKGEGVEEQPDTSLKELQCFYEAQHTIVWPMLKNLKTDCSALLKIVASEHLRLIQGNEQPVLLVEEVCISLQLYFFS
ncbi:hypothetical protein GOBAR_DD11937 [Gossypium barbadense]|nr:hypothetical protein GOBAR_DD11937 [Gossypium barbadense]